MVQHYVSYFTCKAIAIEFYLLLSDDLYGKDLGWPLREQSNVSVSKRVLSMSYISHEKVFIRYLIGYFESKAHECGKLKAWNCDHILRPTATT